MSRVGVMSAVFMLMVAVFIGGTILNELENVMVDHKPGRGTDFNSTIDALVENTWTTFIFLALGIMLIGAAFILRSSGLWGEVQAQQRRQVYR
jgi:hypothetical protein